MPQKSIHDVETFILGIVAAIAAFALLAPVVVFMAARKSPDRYRSLPLSVPVRITIANVAVSAFIFFLLYFFEEYFATSLAGQVQYKHLALYLAIQTSLLALVFLFQPLWKYFLPKQNDLVKTIY